MSKSRDILFVSATDFTDFVTQCTKVIAMAASIIQKNIVEALKEEASSESKAEAAVEDPKEEAATDGIVVHNKSNTKPFDMVIE